MNARAEAGSKNRRQRGLTHVCPVCIDFGKGSRSAKDERFLLRLAAVNEPEIWLEHTEASSRAQLAELCCHGPRVLVSAHDQSSQSLRSCVELVRAAGTDMVVFVNGSLGDVPVDYALSIQSPVHLVTALNKLRQGTSLFCAVWQTSTAQRPSRRWAHDDRRIKRPVGPVALARRASVPITVVHTRVRGSVRRRLELRSATWQAPCDDLDDASRALFDFVRGFARLKQSRVYWDSAAR